MKCEDALLLISGHIDQENTPEEEAQLLQHLEVCAECRGVLRAFLNINNSVQQLDVEPPAELHQNVMKVIRAEAIKPKKQLKRWVGLAVAAAVAIAVGLTAIPKFEQTSVDPAAPMMVRSMAVADVSADPADESSASPQDIAVMRQAAVAVTYELLAEMEICPCETLNSGELLYCFDDADAAEELSEQYNLELYLPEITVADVSYVLLLSQQ